MSTQMPTQAAAPDLKSSADRLISLDELDQAIRKHPAFKSMNGEQAENWLNQEFKNAVDRGEIDLGTRAFIYLLRPKSQGPGYSLSLIRNDKYGTLIRHYAFKVTPNGYKFSQFRGEMSDKDDFIFFQTIEELINRIIEEELYRMDLIYKVASFLNAFASGQQGWRYWYCDEIANSYIPARNKSTRKIQKHITSEEAQERITALHTTLQRLVSEIKPLLEQLNFDVQFKEQVTQTFSLFQFQGPLRFLFTPSFQLNTKALHHLVCIRERYKELFRQYVFDQIESATGFLKIKCHWVHNIMEYFHDPKEYFDADTHIPNRNFYNNSGCYSLEYTKGDVSVGAVPGTDMRIPGYSITEGAKLLSQCSSHPASLQTFKPYFDGLMANAKEAVKQKKVKTLLLAAPRS